MKWNITKTLNGAIFNIVAEPGDSPEQVTILRRLRHSQSKASGKIEGVQDEISLFVPILWAEEESQPEP